MDRKNFSPNTLIIGPPKCGTTSLFKWLAAHPDVCGSQIKETYALMDPGHIFTPEYLPTLASAGESAFEQHFQHVADESILLEATPHHFNQETALAFAKGKQCKAILILRAPEQRIFSQFQFNRHTLAGFTALDFTDYVDILLSGVSGHSWQTSPRIEYVLSTALEASTYHNHLQAWQGALGRDGLFVVLFETMVAEPHRTLKGVCEWLGIDPDFYETYAIEAANQTFRPRFPKLHTALRRLGGHDAMKTDTLKTWFSPFHFLKPKVLRDFVDGVYFSAQIRPILRTEADSHALARLRDYFKDKNAELAALGVDVSPWQQGEFAGRPF